jgi:hypothetical protein
MIYECHITCDQKDAEEASRVATWHGWKTSEIARDPTLGNDTYFYLTSHSTDLIVLHKHMDYMARFLADAGVRVLRKKIELIVYDTKRQD